MPEDNVAYKGQVALLPPHNRSTIASDHEVLPNRSYSYGVAMIFGKGGRWEYIRKEDYLKPAMADTLCRGMGFTHALLSSVMNHSLSTYIYNYTYDLSFM